MPSPTFPLLQSSPAALVPHFFWSETRSTCCRPTAAYLMCFFKFRSPGGHPFFVLPTLLPHWPRAVWPSFATGGASTLPWRSESETALHTFERGLSFKPRHLSQEDAINHPCVSWFSMIWATCLGRASSNAVFDVQTCQKHRWSHHTAEFQCGISFLLPFPVCM